MFVLTKDRVWRLLVINILAHGLGNILIIRVGGFAVTLPHLVFGFAVAALALHGLVPRGALLVVVSLFLCTEIFHALVSGFVSDLQWYFSLIQFIVYSVGFCFLANVDIEYSVLERNARWVLKLSIVLAALGIGQFLLLNMGIPALLPKFMRAGTLNPMDISYRYGGFVPAVGFATEPSTWALTLTGLLALNLTCYRHNIIEQPTLWLVAVGLLFAAVILSFSVTGLVIAAGLMLVSLAFGVGQKHLLIFFGTFAVFGVVALGTVLVPQQARMERVLSGKDASGQLRVGDAFRLLTARSPDVEYALVGTGLGMEMRALDTYAEAYEIPRSWLIEGIRSVKIHNIWSAVRYYQGWLGLLGYTLLLVISFCAFDRSLIPLYAYFSLAQFGHGWYLSVAHWSLLAIMAVVASSVAREHSQTLTERKVERQLQPCK